MGEPPYYNFHTYTENISEGGLKVILEKELKVGSLVKLELFVTSKESFPIKCNGVIAWTNKANPGGTSPDLFETGIQFLDLFSNNYYQLLLNVIHSYLDKNPQDNK